jgi:ABC-type tungstate transport system permease subunit
VAQRAFILCGPLSGFEEADSALGAFEWIAESSLPYISQVDSREALLIENSFWETLGIDPDELPERERLAGGSAKALEEARARQAYALIDRSIWEEGPKESLLLACATDELICRYSVVTLNPSVFPGSHVDEGAAFADWMKGEKAGAIVDGIGGPLGLSRGS